MGHLRPLRGFNQNLSRRLGPVDRRLIKALERVSVGDLRPDLTLVLDVPAETGLKRAAGRRRKGAAADRFEAEVLEFHRRLRQAYLALAQVEKERCILIERENPRLRA